MEDDARWAAADAQAAFGQEFFSSVDGNRDAERAGFDGKKERSFLEGEHAAVGRAGAFDKSSDVDAMGEDATGLGDAALSVSAAACAIDGDELSLAEADAEDGQVHERTLHERGGAAGDERDERGGIEIGDVVGHEDAGAIAGNAVETLGAEANAGEAATGREHEAGGFVERKHVAGEPAPGNEQERRRNAEGDHVGGEEKRGEHAGFEVSAAPRW